jgi:3-oxoacyl-[acyl-carrier protein] reductase
MNLNLTGKRVLITGSSRGIGLAIAKAFLEEGARVVLTGRRQSVLEQLRGELSEKFPSASVLPIPCDLTDGNAIKPLREEIVNAWNGLDILILNLGNGKSKADPIPSAADFEAVRQVNFDSAVNTTREFYPLLQKSGGNMLFIASIAGGEACGAPTDYAVAKSALIAYSKNLARKVAADGVRVNCVAPGNVYFKGGRWDEKLKADPRLVWKLIVTTVPMRRFGKPEEIAAATVFLASDRSSFTTGACLVIDGGQTVGIF